MPQPSMQEVQNTNIPLTMLAEAQFQAPDAFIADKVFPVVPVPQVAGFFYRLRPDAFYRIDGDGHRAPGSIAREIGYDIDKAAPFITQEYAKRHKMPRPIQLQQRQIGQDPDARGQRLTSNQLLLERDQNWVNTFFKTGVWATDYTGVAAAPGAGQFLQWDQAGATPVNLIRTTADAIELATGGYRPNVLVLGPQVVTALADSSDILNRVQYVERAFPDPAMLAAAFNVERVVRASAIVNTAKENTAGSNMNLTWMFPKGALLVYANPNPGLDQISGGYIFSWRGYLGGDAQVRIRKYPDEDSDSDFIEGQTNYAMAQSAATAGVFFTSVIA